MPRGRPGITPRLNKSQKKATGPRTVANERGGGCMPVPGPGRPKGSRNKISGDLKRLILEALANAHETGDEVDYLIAQATLPNPSPFMSLVGKCITQEMSGDLDIDIDIHLTFGD